MQTIIKGYFKYMITVTDVAAKKIKANLDKRGKGLGIKVGIRTTGCSGLAYVLEYVDETWAGSTSFRHDNFSIVVDNKDLAVVDGIEIDYVRQGLNEGFEFTNPIEKDRCGCGESFRI
jgi:iron-sulfur cluster assembly protein